MVGTILIRCVWVLSSTDVSEYYPHQMWLGTNLNRCEWVLSSTALNMTMWAGSLAGTSRRGERVATEAVQRSTELAPMVSCPRGSSSSEFRWFFLKYSFFGVNCFCKKRGMLWSAWIWSRCGSWIRIPMQSGCTSYLCDRTCIFAK